MLRITSVGDAPGDVLGDALGDVLGGVRDLLGRVPDEIVRTKKAGYGSVNAPFLYGSLLIFMVHIYLVIVSLIALCL